MIKNPVLILAAALVLVVPASLHAKGDPEKKAARKAARAALAQFDKDDNGAIDGAERDAMRKAFESKTDESLKRFDLDADGKLSDTEIAAIHAGKKGGKGGKKKKKDAV